MFIHELAKVCEKSKAISQENSIHYKTYDNNIRKKMTCDKQVKSNLINNLPDNNLG